MATSPAAPARLIEDPATDVVISIVAYWELQIKQTIKKLRVASEYNDRLWEWFDAGGFKRLGLQRSHCDRYRVLRCMTAIFRQDVNRAGPGRRILDCDRRSAIQKVRRESRLVK